MYLSISESLSDVTQRVYSAALSVMKSIDDFFTRCHQGTAEYIRSFLSCFTARFVLYSINELTGNEHQPRADAELEKLIALGSQALHNRFATADGHSLSTVQLTKNSHRKAIIYFPASYEIWQTAIDFLKQLHTEAEVDVYAINYRRSGSSTGFPENEHVLVEDGLNYVRDLISKGVANPILFGSDIGAAVATKIAAQLEQDVDLVSLRPYGSLTEVIRQVFPLAPDFSASFAEAMNWGLDTQDALPHLRKNLICMYSEKDPYVPTPARLHTALATNLKSLQIFKMDESAFAQEFPALAEDPDWTPHIRPLASSERAQLIDAIKKL